MGTPMAHRLLASGYPLSVWNRTSSKAQALGASGAIVHTTPTAAAQDADIVITMLADGDVVESLLFDPALPGVASVLKKGALVIDMSSILPAQAKDHAARLAQLGVNTLDAPVSGGTLGAEAGTLAIMVGGLEVDFDRARTILGALGHPVHVGPAGSGQLAKLANQMIVGITIGAVAEALLMAERGGADPAKVRQALRGGFAESRVLDVHGQRMVEGDFTKRGALSTQLKDLRNALHTSAELAFDAPITAQLAALYESAAAHGLGELDQSALFKELQGRQIGRSMS